MKRLIQIVSVLLALSANAFAATRYTTVVSATTANTTVTFGSKPIVLDIANRGTAAVFIDDDGTASASDTTSTKLESCEGILMEFPQASGPDSIGVITGSSTATVNVAAYFIVGNAALDTFHQKITRYALSPSCATLTNERLTGTLTVDGASTLTGVVTAPAGIQGNATVKALTAASATNFTLVSVASGSYVAGYIPYSIEATDATDYQARSGVLVFSAVNKAGTVTCTVATVTSAVEVAAVSSGTLTNTFTCADSTSNGVLIKANAASSLTETVLQIRYRVNIAGTATVTAQ